jgi:hypothetical protein
MKFQTILACATLGVAYAVTQPAAAASGEMGTGVPRFGIYSDPAVAKIQVWGLDDATISFPAGCTYLLLNPATMGLDAYKLAAAALIAAKVSGMRIRFFAHAPRDGGCGIDYVELQS